MSLADRILSCVDCGSPFTFTVGEQQFYQMKGLMNEPKRCPSCRSAAKIARQSGSYPGGYRPRREMHDVICAECGAETQVPFLPRNDRPVYCSDCFDKVRAR
ncbi:MAG TPA: CxxC-x17-CxxC domain-containing protein [Chloroflexota bacterium]|nr:CxxC-x17-CxxC domain-containing protein [Chloroflexota bacterium]